MKPKWPIGIFIASAVVLVSAFLPWGSMQASFKIALHDTPLAGLPERAFGNLDPFKGIVVTMTGWNGSLELGGLTLPNWLVVVAALAISAFCALRAASVWEVHPIVNILLASYGIFHCVALALVLLSNSGRVNVGLIATLLAFITMAIVLARAYRASQTSPNPEPTAEP